MRWRGLELQVEVVGRYVYVSLPGQERPLLSIRAEVGGQGRPPHQQGRPPHQPGIPPHAVRWIAESYTLGAVSATAADPTSAACAVLDELLHNFAIPNPPTDGVRRRHTNRGLRVHLPPRRPSNFGTSVPAPGRTILQLPTEPGAVTSLFQVPTEQAGAAVDNQPPLLTSAVNPVAAMVAVKSAPGSDATVPDAGQDPCPAPSLSSQPSFKLRRAATASDCSRPAASTLTAQHSAFREPQPPRCGSPLEISDANRT